MTLKNLDLYHKKQSPFITDKKNQPRDHFGRQWQGCSSDIDDIYLKFTFNLIAWWNEINIFWKNVHVFFWGERKSQIVP